VRAIDTNVIVRFLTGDDPAQAAKARKLIEAADLFVPTTVLLETEWVLRSAYDFAPSRIVAALTAFAGLPGIRLEDPPVAAQALAWMEAGVDFADALHLASARDCDGFFTFDRRLARSATQFAGLKVATP
jgi:predicted nucleic acid-binding protein